MIVVTIKPEFLDHPEDPNMPTQYKVIEDNGDRLLIQLVDDPSVTKTVTKPQVIWHCVVG